MHTDGKNQNSFLNPEELSRYSRHLSLAEVGQEGQIRLKQARVLCIGAGGLGSPLLLYLAAAGIGTIGIIDSDTVDLSNLQRQILFNTNDIGKSKSLVAKEKLSLLNNTIQFIPYQERLIPSNAVNIISQYDIIADGSDNFETRYLVNDVCFHLRKPNVGASILQFSGQCSVFTASPNDPCYRCLYPSSPLTSAILNCAEAGVLGALPGIMGSIQATEVIKLILNIGNSLAGRLLSFDALSMRFKEFTFSTDPSCILCAEKRSLDKINYDMGAICKMNSSAENDQVSNDQISPVELHQLFEKKEDFCLIDVREPHEYAVCHIGGKLIPLAQLSQQIDTLDPDKLTIVHCHAGIRGQKAIDFLKQAGFKHVKNLTGGLAAWQKIFS
jgi:molybdopterin/thiamine biosynthesis adenylyltransferase/rhodanese-related sulfurtransferase